MTEEKRVRDDMQEIRERVVRSDARLEGLEGRMGEVYSELRAIAKLLRGNGEQGLVAEVELHGERIATLQRHWYWIVWGMVALVVALVKALVLG